MASDPTLRFSGRVENYVEHPPDYGTDYAEVSDKHPDLARVQAFVGSTSVTLITLEHRQFLDLHGLRGRLPSSSYTPECGHPNHEPMLARPAEISRACQHDGQVSFDHDTLVHRARLAAG